MVFLLHSDNAKRPTAGLTLAIECTVNGTIAHGKKAVQTTPFAMEAGSPRLYRGPPRMLDRYPGLLTLALFAGSSRSAVLTLTAVCSGPATIPVFAPNRNHAGLIRPEFICINLGRDPGANEFHEHAPLFPKEEGS